MVTRKRSVAAVLCILVLTALLPGCTDDGDDGWGDPAAVFAAEMEVDELVAKVVVRLALTDDEGDFTKAEGEFRIIISDSYEVELYNGTKAAKVADFEEGNIAGGAAYYFELDLLFSVFKESNDRVAGKFDLLNRMYASAWFIFGDRILRQEAGGQLVASARIPEGLFADNTAPKASLEGPTLAFVGYEAAFNASLSTDDTHETLLDYRWSFGDVPDQTFVGDAEVTHTYDEPMSVSVKVTVMDPEGGEDVATLDVEVRWPEQVTVTDWGVIDEPGEHYEDTYVVVTIGNTAPFGITLYSLGANVGDGSDWWWSNGTVPDQPNELGTDEDVTLTIYFAVDDPGFDFDRLMLWGGREFMLP